MVEVSIFCLTYNHENYIRQALQSFIDQKTDFAFEILIHDDASSDNTPVIIKEFAEKYPDIIKPVLQKDNMMSKGKRITTEFLFPLSVGKYICNCEGDDYWCDIHKLQKQYDFMEKHLEYSACVHNTGLLDIKHNNMSYINSSEVEKDITAEDIFLRWGSIFHTSSIFYRREYCIIPEELFEKGLGDIPRAIYLVYNGKIRYFPDKMSVHRVNVKNSWTTRNVNSNDEKKVIHHYETLNKLLERADRYTENQYQEYIQKAIRWNECIILQWQDQAKQMKEETGAAENAALELRDNTKEVINSIMNIRNQ